jgi:UDP-glucose:(heptosyl)LPS alpha-1,3-glucosyltransferase
MACGLPIITSEKSGTAEILDGQAGFSCDSKDIQALTKAMLALSDKSLATQMGQQARQIAEKYNWSLIGDSLVNLYQSLEQQP